MKDDGPIAAAIYILVVGGFLLALFIAALEVSA